MMKQWTLNDIQARLVELAGADGPQAHLRRRIVEVATEHFVRYGYRRASISDIARDVGIGKGSLYLHFDSKSTLLVAALSTEKLTLLPQIERMFALPESERLLAYLRLSLRYMLTAPLTSRLLRGDPELERVLQGLDAATADDRAKNEAMLAAIVAAAAPNLPAAQQQRVSAVVAAALRVAAHLPESTSAVEVDEFVELYSQIVTTGVAGLKP